MNKMAVISVQVFSAYFLNNSTLLIDWEKVKRIAITFNLKRRTFRSRVTNHSHLYDIITLSVIRSYRETIEQAVAVLQTLKLKNYVPETIIYVFYEVWPKISN
jgi:hypothetical protein